MNTSSDTPTPLLCWKANIYPKHKRGIVWIVTMLSIIALLVLYSVLAGSWSFTTVIVMFAAVYWFIHQKAVDEREITIFEEGVVIEKKAMIWEDCTGFWFLEGPGYHELHLEHSKKVIGDFVIQTGSQNIEDIRSTLTKFVPELEDRKEARINTLARICKL